MSEAPYVQIVIIIASFDLLYMLNTILIGTDSNKQMALSAFSARCGPVEV